MTLVARAIASCRNDGPHERFPRSTQARLNYRAPVDPLRSQIRQLTHHRLRLYNHQQSLGGDYLKLPPAV